MASLRLIFKPLMEILTGAPPLRVSEPDTADNCEMAPIGIIT